MAGNIIGIDIGGTHLRAGLVEAGGAVRSLKKAPTAEVLTSSDVLSDLSSFIRAFRGDAPVDVVSIGFPATLDRARTRVLQAPNLPYMENLPVVAVLTERLGLPMLIERDVTFALCHDMAKYRIPKEGVVCGIYFGTGIGNAICIDGKALPGRNGIAGELGHIPVDGSDLPCGCGNAGCMENLAAGKALTRLRKARYPGTDIADLFIRHGAETPLLQFVDRMAMTVATEVNILDPDCVLVGGGVPNMKGFPKDTLRARILRHARKPFPADPLNLIFTDDEPEKCVIGAALYARSRQA